MFYPNANIKIITSLLKSGHLSNLDTLSHKYLCLGVPLYYKVLVFFPKEAHLTCLGVPLYYKVLVSIPKEAHLTIKTAYCKTLVLRFHLVIVTHLWHFWSFTH